MKYKLSYHHLVAKDLKKIPHKNRQQIQSAIEQKLLIDPLAFSDRLRGTLKPLLKLRIGDYRVLYHLVGNTISILMIAHRKEVYTLAARRA